MKRDTRLICRAVLALASLGLAISPLSAAVQNAADAQQLAREVIENEIRAEVDDQNLWSYRELERRDGDELLYEYRQTRQGTIHRLLAVNGRPLNARQRRAEDERIQRLIASPAALREEQKKETADAEQCRRFLTLFPQAFRYREEGRQGETATLRFAPNPGFRPQGNEARVLHSLQGTMVVNLRQKRLVSIQGRLMTEVKFWGGLLGYLDPGGTFSVSCENVAPGDWELKSLDVAMRGKALLFKTIGVEQHERYSDYSPVPPDVNLQRAAELLRKSASE
jgi:hypothetical protein